MFRQSVSLRPRERAGARPPPRATHENEPTSISSAPARAAATAASPFPLFAHSARMLKLAISTAAWSPAHHQSVPGGSSLATLGSASSGARRALSRSSALVPLRKSARLFTMPCVQKMRLNV